jgi:DNA invertase Pin-like site-specific DNA recombinase/uncharacterized Zn finger protein (UPF0148 family)
MFVSKLYHKRAALYIRVSTQEQSRHGYSLGEQRLDLENYASAKDYEIVGVYADEGASARSKINRRHELQRLLRDVEAGLVDVIISKSLDRLTRNVRDFYRLKDTFDTHGTTLEFTQEPDYDTSTTSGRLLLNLRLSIAQNEADTTSDRIKYVFQGMRRDKKIITGRVPFGYRIENKRIVIERNEAEIVRYIYAEALRGRSAYSLVNDVYDRYGQEIKYTTLLWILKNKSYTGTMQGVEALAPAIISEEDFAKVQSVLARHPRRKDSSRVYLFSGLIICPVCGRRLSVHRSYSGKQKVTYYQCENHYRATRKGTACPYTYSIREERVESFLVNNVAALIADTVRETASTKRKTVNASQTLSKVARSLERLNEIYVMGNIEKEAYKARYEALKKQERILLAETIPHKIKIPAILRGDQFPSIYETWDREERRAFWQGLIQRIEFKTAAPTPRDMPLDLRVIFF